MFKSIGLGICCLTLGISGVTRASVVNIDPGKYGDDKCLKIEKICHTDTKCVDFNLGDKDDCKLDVKDICDFKPVLLCHDDKDKDKDTCKLVWTDKHDHLLCDIGDKDGKHGHDCLLVIDRCGFDPCGHQVCDPAPCDPAAVPAPASAGFGGIGVIGMMLVARLRSRRSAAI